MSRCRQELRSYGRIALTLALLIQNGYVLHCHAYISAASTCTRPEYDFDSHRKSLGDTRHMAKNCISRNPESPGCWQEIAIHVISYLARHGLDQMLVQPSLVKREESLFPFVFLFWLSWINLLIPSKIAVCMYGYGYVCAGKSRVETH
jgi:hypothetical protein